jgi:hypothetical protein
MLKFILTTVLQPSICNVDNLLGEYPKIRRKFPPIGATHTESALSTEKTSAANTSSLYGVKQSLIENLRFLLAIILGRYKKLSCVVIFKNGQTLLCLLKL